MTEFTLFEQALEKYNAENIVKDKGKNKVTCKHEDVINEAGITSCLECGEQIKREIMHEKEWRYYGYSDSKRNSDPNRVQIRRNEERSINKDVENMGFSDIIVTKANEIYSKVTKGQIYRGESRKSVVFACIYHSYKIANKCQTPKNLMDIFGLNKKSSLKGLKIVNVNLDGYPDMKMISLTAVHHIHDIMDKFSATPNQKDEVIDYYNKTKNRSSKLNRSRPQSIAASLTYYWICKKNIDISLNKFAQKANLSELTINKNAKEVARVLGTPDII